MNYDAQQKNIRPNYIELGSFPMLGIAGNSGSGKTTTAVLLLCQLLDNNIDVYVADPHGNIPQRSFTSAIQPLEPYLAQKIAIDKKDRLALVQRFFQLFLERKNSQQQHRHAVLFIDEVTAHFLECSSDEAHQQALNLIRISNEGLKLNLHVVLMSQSWKAEYAGSRSLRSSISTIIFHRLSEDETKLFTSVNARMRQSIMQLQPGWIRLFGPGHLFRRIKVPQLEHEDVLILARDLESRLEDKKRFVIDRDHSDHDPDHGDYKAENLHFVSVDHGALIYAETDANEGRSRDHAVQELLGKMQWYITQGYGKERTIKELFGVSKGGKSNRWRVLSGIYDKIKAKTE